jgi:hypothetical protein
VREVINGWQGVREMIEDMRGCKGDYREYERV